MKYCVLYTYKGLILSREAKKFLKLEYCEVTNSAIYAIFDYRYC